MKERIEHTLKVLKGLQLKDIGRAADLEWFIFSSIHNLGSEHDRSIVVAQYALHAECAWRVVGPEGILVASRDRYYPAGSDPYQDMDNFNWDLPGNNRCDEKVMNFIKNTANKPLIVLSIEADYLGGLSLELDDGYVIELFPDDSLEGEYWRFFRVDSEAHHFVVTGHGIDEV